MDWEDEGLEDENLGEYGDEFEDDEGGFSGGYDDDDYENPDSEYEDE